jgi:hypothetical protein
VRVGVQYRPPLLLAGGALLIAIGAGLVAAHVTVFAADETLIQQSAVHYTSDLPNSLFHDLDARATNRLYPLILSIAFRLFSGASAVRFDHVLSVVLFVSAIVPVFLFARTMLDSVWSAVAVALLSVAVPWLTLTSALFTENLSYPLFWWMMLATCRAVWQPAPLRDLVALLSIALLVGTRVQFAAVYIGYLVALLAIAIWRADASAGIVQRFTRSAVKVARGYPLTFAILAVAVAAVVYEKASGQWQTHVEHLLGTYSNVIIRNGLPSNMGEGLLVELIALALGVGLLPAIVSLAWFAKRVASPRPDRRWVYLLVSGVVLLVFLLVTVYSQGGYIGEVTEERYFFYVIPVFWLGTFAALEDRSVRRGELLGCALGLAALYASIPFVSPLTEETAFLAPVESVVTHVLVKRLPEAGLTGLTVQDAIAVVALLAGIITAVLWRRRPRTRLWWTVGAAAALQLLIAGYAYAVIVGKIEGIPGRTGGNFSQLGWLDRGAGSSNVTWLENVPTTTSPSVVESVAEERTTLFWNSRLRSWAGLTALRLPPVQWPLSALPGLALAVNQSDGMLGPAAAAADLDEIVGETGSPFLQLEGTSLARSPDRVLTLTKPLQPVRARWLATGLQPNGSVASGAPVRAFVFAARSSTARALKVTLTVSPASPTLGPTALSLRFGSARERLTLKAGVTPTRVTLPACFAPGRMVVSGSLRAIRSVVVSEHAVAGVIDAVEIAPAAAPPKPCA